MPRTEPRTAAASLLLAALLGAALVVLLVPTAEAQQQTTGPDLKVVITEAPGRIVAGHAGNVRVTVSNAGDTTTLSGYQLRLQVVGRDTSVDLTPDARDTKDNPYTAPTPLAPGESHRLTFLWNASGHPNGTVTIRATVEPFPSGPDANPTNDDSTMVSYVHTPNPRLRPAWTATSERAAAPGGDVPLRFTVENRGTDVDTLVFGILGESDLRANGWTWEFPTPEVTLDPGASTEVAFRLIPTEATVAGETLDGAAKGVSLLAKSRASPTYRDAVALPRLTARQSYGLNLTGPSDVLVLNPAEALNIPIQLQNGGNGADTFQLRLEGPPANPDWIRTFPDGGNVTIDRKATRDVTFSLTSPYTYPTGPLTFTLVASSNNGPAEARLPLRLNVRQVFLLNAELLDGEKLAPAGETVSFRMNITNKGNGDDTFAFSLVEEEPAYRMPNGWAAGFPAGDVVIPGNTSRIVTLDVNVPPGTAAGTVGNFKVRAVSLGSVALRGTEQANATLLAMRATVQAGPRGKMIFDPPANAFVDKDGELRYEIRVLSVGNEPGTFRFEGTRRVVSGTATWNPPLFTPSSLSNLPVGSEGKVEVAIMPPLGARAGDVVEVTVTLKLATGPVLGTRTFKATVSGPDLETSALRAEPPGILYAGDAAQLSAIVTNRGNQDVDDPLEVRFYRSQGAERVLVGTQKLEKGLEAGRSATLRVPLETAALRDAYLLEAVVDEDGKVEELLEDNNLQALTATVRRYAIQITGPRDQTAVPGEVARFGAEPYAIALRNDGSHEETLTVRLTSEHGWIPTSETVQIARLAPGERRVLNFTVRVPVEPGTPSDRVDIAVEHGLRPDFRKALSATVTLRDDTPPRLSDPKVDNPAIAIRDTINLTVRAKDAIKVDRVLARLEYPNQGLFEREMTHAGGDLWRLTAGFDVVGGFNTTFLATDAAGNEQTLRGPAFRVVAGSRPTVEFVGENRSLIAAGFPIPLTIEDPLGIKSVEVILDGLTRNKTLLPHPYVIDTSRFPQGERKVEVRARNLYDEVTSFQFRVTVDNTPPKVKDLTWTEAIPGVPLTLTAVLDDRDLASVKAVIVQGDTRSELPLEAKGDGRYIATFTPTEAVYRVTVNATDKAGNVATQGIDAEIVVEDGSLFAKLLPAHGLVAVLGAVAAIAWVRRRK